MNELSPAAHPEAPALIPGMGMAGQTICPFMSVVRVQPCMKGACELWVELKYGEQKVARCSLSWLAVLNTETRQAIEKLRTNGNAS